MPPDTHEDPVDSTLRLVLNFAWLLAGTLQKGGPTTLRQLRLLQRLAPGASRTGALALSTDVTAPSITLAVTQLVAQGWAVRERDPDDGRVTLVSLTPKGQSVLHESESLLREVVEEILAELGPASLEALAELSASLTTGVERVRKARAAAAEPGPNDGARSRRATSTL